MEIKHTIEILTKDIQDIENLVRNLNNYPSPPRIEIDLAMGKLRNVYELLSMISSDIKADRKVDFSAPTEEHHVPEKGAEKVKERQQSASEEFQESASPMEKSPESPTSEKEIAEKQRASEKRQAAEEQRTIKEQKAAEEKRAVEVQKATDEQRAKEEQRVVQEPLIPNNSEAAVERQKEPVTQEFKEEIKKASIVAEKFAANKSINEKISPGSSEDLSSRLTGEPIDSIKRNIGINDRFLIIRELLNGDNERYNQLVQELDACTNFDQAHNLIEKNFPDQMDHEGVVILVKLSRRRFLNKNV